MCLWLYQDGGSAVVDCSVLFVRLVFQKEASYVRCCRKDSIGEVIDRERRVIGDMEEWCQYHGEYRLAVGSIES